MLSAKDRQATIKNVAYPVEASATNPNGTAADAVPAARGPTDAGQTVLQRPGKTQATNGNPTYVAQSASTVVRKQAEHKMAKAPNSTHV